MFVLNSVINRRREQPKRGNSTILHFSMFGFRLPVDRFLSFQLCATVFRHFLMV